MEVTNSVIFISVFLNIYQLLLTTANCQEKCEQSIGGISQTVMKNLAMLGHSFKNFTLSKTYDCHVKCFHERCRCQAYQMRRDRCELLDEDRLSAPDDFVSEDGYTYFDINREYVKQVSQLSCSVSISCFQCHFPNVKVAQLSFLELQKIPVLNL